MSFQLLPKEEMELFKQLPDLKVIFDVGARDDREYYDIYPEAEFHLFEPNTQFVTNLRNELGDKPNVHINAVGVGDMQGEVDYNTTSQAFMEGEAQIESGDAIYTVITLDSYVKEYEITSIDFLKIDVEGYDFKVLRGAPNAISMSRFIQYEHWDNKTEYHKLLGERFDMEYIGYRNVLCMNKRLVDLKTRNRLRKFIEDNNYKNLH